MNIDQYLDELEDLVENGSKVAFSNKIGIDGKQMKTLLEDIRLSLPTEIAQAKSIVADRNNILVKAKEEAVAATTSAQEKSRALVAAAEDRVRELALKTETYYKNKIDEAEVQAKQIVANANDEAAQIKAAANEEATAMIEASEIVIQSRATAEKVSAEADAYYQQKTEEASAEAKRILDDAAARSAEITKLTKEHCDEKINSANKWSTEIRTSAADFAQDIINEADRAVTNALNGIRNAKDNMKAIIEA